MKFNFLVSIAAIMAVASAQSNTSPVNEASVSQFTAYSQAYFKGTKQTLKPTPGCYRLSGGEVASFNGISSSQYGFYSGSDCSGKVLYSSSSAPVSKISPSIKPRSLRILAGSSGPYITTLVTYPGSNYSGSKQTVKGIGCQTMTGARVSSFKGYGGYRYKFFPDDQCNGSPLLQSMGGDKSNTPTIKPFSVYIYKN